MRRHPPPALCKQWWASKPGTSRATAPLRERNSETGRPVNGYDTGPVVSIGWVDSVGRDGRSFWKHCGSTSRYSHCLYFNFPYTMCHRSSSGIRDKTLQCSLGRLTDKLLAAQSLPPSLARFCRTLHLREQGVATLAGVSLRHQTKKPTHGDRELVGNGFDQTFFDPSLSADSYFSKNGADQCIEMSTLYRRRPVTQWRLSTYLASRAFPRRTKKPDNPRFSFAQRMENVSNIHTHTGSKC